MKSWQIQEVKQHLSEVIRFALNEGPQRITYRGEPNAWIISEKDYAKLVQRRESIVDFFQRSPHRKVKIPIKRRKDLPRNVKL